MTPQERKLVDELFARLEKLEDVPRDNDAIDAINAGLDRAPNSLYPLVQTVLVQEEALKRADARIRELETQLGAAPPPDGGGRPGFLDGMRDSLMGRRETQGSVPSVGKTNVWGPAYNQSAGPPPSQPSYEPAQPQQPQGGSFLGTAASAAAGVVGGALLMNSFKGMFGGHQPGQQSQKMFDQPGGDKPWDSKPGGGDLARQAGIDDIGKSGTTAAHDDSATHRAGLFDMAQSDDETDTGGEDDDGGDFDMDEA